jgi:hypothetical protein
MRCIRCGNDNPEDNRFCGMCGATLLARTTPVPETQTQRAASGTIPSTVPSSAAPTAVTTARPIETPRPPAAPPAPEVHREPTISGPSFLGLNDAPRKRASLSIDPHSSHSSRGVDYLLDDEEERRGGSAGKVFLILLALVLAAGFGYLRWKHQGLPWINNSPNKPSPTAEAPADGDAASPSPVTPAKPRQDPQAVTPVPTQPAATSSQPPADTVKTDTPATTPDSDSAATSAAPPKSSAPTVTKNDPAEPATKVAGTKANTPADDSDDDTAGDSEPAAPAPKPDAAKPAKIEKPPAGRDASPRPRTPVAPVATGDPVGEAQKYLYGRGAAQDCDHGLRVLKPAANAANPKAMIQMGALYSAGLCTPRDLPTAYRWFALALRKDPENISVQRDLQKLWGEMTQPERQLAIKLTQ